MNIKTLKICLHLGYCGIFAIIPSIIRAQPTDQMADYFQAVREEYSGENAFETVAFVEKYWRIAGNEGFNKSIRYVVEILKGAGYTNEGTSPESTLTFRIETRPMKRLTWEPVDASVDIVGETEPLLIFKTNRNMIAVNSWSTNGIISAEVIHVPPPVRESIKNIDIKGKILFTDGNLRGIISDLIEKGALGVMDYGVPDYLNPGKNVNSIQFRSIGQDETLKPWAIVLSKAARDRLMDKFDRGIKVEVNLNIQTKIYQSEELTLVAEVKGSKYPEQRFVFSAHVQEPGANDNASGVGVLAEMARTLAKLVNEKIYKPERTITFLFGDEFISTRRFITDDQERAKNILWGMSLDMVGEDTEKTGGSFLIEKMPDPAAVWLRGEDNHTEWGGSVMNPSEIVPHYFNDLVLNILKDQGKYAQWTVNVNPFEGGSDHVPFLQAGIPGLLLWHFTDQFYHTDGDRIDKVSKSTLKNVGTGALVTSMFLASSGESQLDFVLQLIKSSANDRFQTEVKLSMDALANGSTMKKEEEIIRSWIEYYVDVCATVVDLLQNEESDHANTQILLIQKEIRKMGVASLGRF